MSALPKTVLAIDPGTSKVGMAIVRRDGDNQTKALWHEVAPTEYVVSKIHEAYTVAPFELIIVGSGTGSGQVLHAIREHLSSMAILVVDETNTSLQARERYWEHHPRRGWRRLLPATLQVPPGPVDAFVAQILAERVLL